MKFILLFLCSTVPSLATAQREVARRSFNFQENTLTIEVISEDAGMLRILRGSPGRLEVAARAPEGFPAFALGGRDGDKLRLTSMGADRADYLVVVPEDVRVRVSLPNRRGHDIASTRPAADYSWGAAPVRGIADRESRRAMTAELAGAPGPDGLYLSHYSAAVPRQFSVLDVENVSRIEVRFEGTDFRLATSRLVGVQPGRADVIDFRAGEPSVRVVLTLPLDARDFRLVLGDQLALEAKGGRVRSMCNKMITQTVAGRRLYTYFPAEKLICR